VLADLGNRPAGTVDQIDEKFVGLSLSNDAINRNLPSIETLTTVLSSIRLAVSPILALGRTDQLGYRDRLNTFDACDFFHSPQHSREVLFSIACQLL
jgi:hypothetical protein